MARSNVDQYASSVANAPRVPLVPPTTGEDTTLAPYLPPHDPLDGDAKERVRAVLRDIPITAIASNWTYARVNSALEMHTAGIFFDSAQLWDAACGDDRIQAVLGSRLGALTGLPVTHAAPTFDDLGEVPDEDALNVALAAWREAYPKMCTKSVVAEVKRWAIGMGFAVSQVQWDTTVTPWQPYIKVWHPQFIYYRWDTRSYWVMTQDGTVEVTPGDGTWFLHAPTGPSRGWMQGAVRAIALPWLLRQQAYRDWARYNEVHGLPMLKAITPSVADEDAKSAFVNALATLGQEAVIELPQNVDGTGFDLTLLEAQDRSWDAFKGLIDQADSSITLTIAWQNLTTEVKEGSFAAARVHGDVKQSCLEFDESTFTHDVHEQLARPFCDFNFGDANLAPVTHYDTEPVEDQVAQMKALLDFTSAVKNIRDAGVTPDIQKMADKYQIKLAVLDVGPLPGKTPADV